MCPPPDQASAALDQADAATMPLPDSTPDSASIITENNYDTRADSVTEEDKAQDGFAPLPSESETAVIPSGPGSLATIEEQTESDSMCPNDKHVVGKPTGSSSAPEESIEHKSLGHPAPTDPSDVLASVEPESVTESLTDNKCARPASQQKDTGDNAVRSTTPESVLTTNPAIVVSVQGAEGLNHGTSEALAKPPATNDANAPAKSEDQKFVDPNDRDNIGNDVIKFFYTSSTRKRPSSPVARSPGCCNPHLHRDSDLYIKAKGEDGKAYVFEVVSAILEKASPKFEAMIYGSHTRGNKEEWVWELDDNP